MIYLCIYDNVSKKEIEEKNEVKSQVILSSVQQSTHAWNVHKGHLWETGPLHKKIRFFQFKSFDETIRGTIKDFDDMYLKYGGLCYLDENIKERFDIVKRHLDFMVSQNYKVDVFNNNLLFETVQKSINLYDKFILRRIFETKETGLIYYRPIKEKTNVAGAQEIYKLIKTATNEEIKQCSLLRKVF